MTTRLARNPVSSCPKSVGASGLTLGPLDAPAPASTGEPQNLQKRALGSFCPPQRLQSGHPPPALLSATAGSAGLNARSAAARGECRPSCAGPGGRSAATSPPQVRQN